jgi:SPX domain protein involved in polyphosphate accumulation
VYTAMKFGKYLVDKERPSWAGKYLDYAGLKDLIKSASREHESHGSFEVHSPRTASLTVLRGENRRDSAEEQFFRKLEDEVDKIGGFTSAQVQSLRSRLYDLQQRIDAAGLHQGELEDGSDKANLQEELLEEAKDIGDEFLQLEKYVNLNYMGLHKILKKHDKQLPHSPCRQFYISHLHNQPWVQGSYADLLVTLGHVYADIRGDKDLGSNARGAEGGGNAPGMLGLSPSGGSRSMSPAEMLGSSPVARRNTALVGEETGMPRVLSAHKMLKSRTKYWVDVRHISKVKHMILPHLPVYQFDENEYTGDSQLVNSVYLDNSSLEVYHSRLKDDGRSGMVVKLSWYGSQEPIDVHVQVRLASIAFLFSDDSYGAHNSIRRAY